MHGRPPIDYAGYAYSGVKELLSAVNRAKSLDAGSHCRRHRGTDL